MYLCSCKIHLVLSYAGFWLCRGSSDPSDIFLLTHCVTDSTLWIGLDEFIHVDWGFDIMRRHTLGSCDWWTSSCLAAGHLASCMARVSVMCSMEVRTCHGWCWEKAHDVDMRSASDCTGCLTPTSVEFMQQCPFAHRSYQNKRNEL